MMFYTALALFLSVSAILFCSYVLFAWRRTSIRNLSRSLSELSEAQESLNLQLRSVKVRLSALSKPRKGGRFASEEEKPAEDDKQTESAAEWKRKMNLQLAMRGMKQ